MSDNKKNKKQLIKELEELRLENNSLKLQAAEAKRIKTIAGARKKAEELLVEMDNRYNELMERARDAIFSLSLQGILVSLNRAFEQITGWKIKDWIGKPFVGLLDPEDIPLAVVRFSNVLKGNSSQAMELRIRKKTGGYVYAEILASPQMKEGKIIGLLGIARDITERKSIELSLYEKESRINSISNNFTAGMIYQVIIRPDGTRKFTYLSDSVQQLYGISPEDGLSDANLIYSKVYEDDIKLLTKAEENAVKTLSTIRSEARILDPSGEMRWSSFVSTPKLLEDGSVCFDGIEFIITERKKVEEKLRLSEERFSKLFHSSPDPILVTELKSGKIIEVNKSFEQFSGYSHDELVGHQVLDFNMYSPSDRQRFVSLLKKEGSIHNVEFNLRNKAGNEMLVSSSAEIIEINKEPHAITILHDFTERKLAEDALRESEERFKSLSLIGSEGLMIHEEGIILDVNQAFTSLTGYASPDDLIGKNGLEVIKFTPESKKLVLEHIRKNSNETYDIEIVNLNRNIIPAETRGTEIVYRGRKARLVYMRDITDRKKTEDALTESKTLLTSIIDSTNDLIWSVDSERFSLLTFNKGLKDFFKKEGIHIQKDMLLNEILPQVLADKLNHLYLQTLQEGSLITMYQTTIGNRTLWINLHVLSRENKPYAISAFAKDITELMQAEEALIQAKKKAEESDRLKTAFMNNISHEVRTPLNGILGFAQLLLSPDITEEEKSYNLDILNSCSERLLNTITDYMDISLIVSGNVKVHKQPLILSRLVNEIYDKFQTKCIAKNLEFIKQIPSETDNSPLQFDSFLLEKSISHLLDNAIKFTRAGSVILGFQFKNNEYEIFVKDTGSGINKDAQNKIFDFFMQEDSSINRGYEGSGLGLSIVKGLVESMGGKVRLESLKGKGSTFFITLKDEKRITDKIESPETRQSKSRSKISRVVLIADDDEVSLAYFKTILEKASFEYRVAGNGLEAVQLCHNNPEISIVLMDIKMPVMDGLEATKKIREFRKELPIIGVTAYSMPDDKEKIIAAGCDDYITKPVQSDFLLSIINKYV